MKNIIKSFKKVHGKHTLVVNVTILFGLLVVFSLLFSAVASLRVDSPDFNNPIHTNMIYYNGSYLQNFKVEIPNTASFVINESNETITANVYETINASSSVQKVEIAAGQEKFIEPQANYVAIFTNSSNTSTSTLFVGRNDIVNNERYQAIKGFLVTQLDKNDKTSMKRVYEMFKILNNKDVNVKLNCNAVAKELKSNSLKFFGNAANPADFGKVCSGIAQNSTKVLQK